MCVTFKKTKLSGTTILTGTIAGKTARYLHYRNTAGEAKADDVPRGGRRNGRRNGVSTDSSPESLLPSAWDFGAPGKPSLVGLDNCLAFPIFGEFDSIQSIETKSIPTAMDDVEEAVKSLYPRVATLGGGRRSRSMSKGIDSVRILETELYTTILAKDPTDIPGALKELGAAASLYNADIAEKFKKAYPGIPFGLNLFADGAAKKGGLLLTFEPLKQFASVYFIPMLDGHGDLDFSKEVRLDHIVAVGTGAGKGAEVSYSDTASAEAAACLPDHVLGVKFKGVAPMKNGDLVIDKASADKGVWKARRVAPFGLAKTESSLVQFPINIEGPR